MAFAQNLHDVVGLYAPPPPTLSFCRLTKGAGSRRSTLPELPLKRARGVTKMHDYKRSGMTMRFTASNDLYASVIRRDMQPHRN